MCGIGDYTEFITRRLPLERWSVLSFDVDTYDAPLTGNYAAATDPVLHGIPGDNRFSAPIVEKGLRRIVKEIDGSVIWIQHEFGIWPDDQKLISMLKSLSWPKIVTLHTIHFQSPETPAGLRQCEYEFLRELLPNVDAITVFRRGVYNAVTSALPAYSDKVHILRHGIHSYPDAVCLSRQEAKAKLHNYLVNQTDLPQRTKEALTRERALLDDSIVVIGQTGFLSPAKGSELLYVIGKELRKALPSKRIAAVRIGQPRDASQEEYAKKLEQEADPTSEFIIQTLLPLDILPVAQRAFDVNFYWPNDCTQSGIMAHAIIAGKDMEGVGETFKDAGAVATGDMHHLIEKMKGLILCPELVEQAERNALTYAAEYSWENQAERHCALAELAKGAASPAIERIARAESSGETFGLSLEPILA
jgi:hypothetical protein